jgi:micrococcal nuclease
MSNKLKLVLIPMPIHGWIFPARLVRVIDGDTQVYQIDQGMHSYRVETIRLFGVNAPEMHGATKLTGDRATLFTQQWITQADCKQAEWPLVLQTFKSDVFGRYLAIVWRTSDGACLNDDLLSSGNAVIYSGK